MRHNLLVFNLHYRQCEESLLKNQDTESISPVTGAGYVRRRSTIDKGR